MKKSFELAEMFLNGENSIRLSQKQFNWINKVLLKETGRAWRFHKLFWGEDGTEYRINGDGSLYNVTKFEQTNK